MIFDQAERLRNMVRERVNRREHSAHVIAFGSGKGGCGKTNITLNLGLLLSRKGKKVLLYDADINLANIDVLFGITPKFRFLDFVRGDASIGEIIVEIRENLKLIPANSGSINFPEISGEKIVQVIQQILELEEKFDFIFIDTPAGVSDFVIKILGYADDYVLVVTPEPTSIMDAYAVIKLVKYKMGKSVAKLVVNSVNGSVDPVDVANRLAFAADKFLGVKVDYVGSIPYDPVVPKSVLMQKPFVEAFPRSEASVALNKIAEKFLSLDNVKKQISFFGRLAEICGL